MKSLGFRVEGFKGSGGLDVKSLGFRVEGFRVSGV